MRRPMSDNSLIPILAAILAQSAPLMLAILGETITERVGVINLSLDGTMLLTAMAGFAIAFETEKALGLPADVPDTIPVLVGLLAAGLIGALVALLIAWGSIALKQ